MALVPWVPAPAPLPETPPPSAEEQSAYDSALATHNAQVAAVVAACCANEAEVERLGPVVAAIVGEHIQGQTVPEAVVDEAVIRYLSALTESHAGGGAIIRSYVLGGLTMHRITNHQYLWRRCGAEALLSPFVLQNIQVI